MSDKLEALRTFFLGPRQVAPTLVEPSPKEIRRWELQARADMLNAGFRGGQLEVRETEDEFLWLAIVGDDGTILGELTRGSSIIAADERRFNPDFMPQQLLTVPEPE